MKLHHFIQKELSEDSVKAQEIGKLLKQTAKAPVVEAPVIEAKKSAVTSTKKIDDEGDEGLKQQMRDFAHEQLAKSHPHIHKKHKHYD